jgi:hypothetical protein
MCAAETAKCALPSSCYGRNNIRPGDKAPVPSNTYVPTLWSKHPKLNETLPRV